MKKINLIDCTLRDGGYYNNWHFSEKLIQSYFNTMKNLNILNLEVGFITLENDVGITGNIDKNFFKKFKIDNKINCGVMINAKEIFNNPKEICKYKSNKLFKKIPKKINFIRFACHHDEILPLLRFLKIKKLNQKIFINIMQISGIPKNQLLKISKISNELKINYIYIADSFGCLSQSKTREIIKNIKSQYNLNVGIHAHDNLGFALKNSTTAIKNGANWIDSTVMGMGRGAGNLKTEDIIKFFNFSLEKRKQLNLFINRYFRELKNKYKWGKNRYYEFAAKNLIHPTYIQEILSNEIYGKSEYDKILSFLKKLNTKKFNPYNLLNLKYFINNNIGQIKGLNKVDLQKNILVVGPSKLINHHKKYCRNLIKDKNNISILALNKSNFISDKFIDYRLTCHPQRLYSDISFHLKNKNKLILPAKFLNKKILKNLKNKKKHLINYGIVIKKVIKSPYKVFRNYCHIEKPLVILYLFSLLEKFKVKNIIFVGFKGFTKDNPFQDNTQEYLNFFKKNNPNVKMRILGPTSYKI